MHSGPAETWDTPRSPSTVAIESDADGAIRVYLTLFRQDLLELAASIRDDLEEARVVIPRDRFERT